MLAFHFLLVTVGLNFFTYSLTAIIWEFFGIIIRHRIFNNFSEKDKNVINTFRRLMVINYLTSSSLASFGHERSMNSFLIHISTCLGSRGKKGTKWSMTCESMSLLRWRPPCTLYAPSCAIYWKSSNSVSSRYRPASMRDFSFFAISAPVIAWWTVCRKWYLHKRMEDLYLRCLRER